MIRRVLKIFLPLLIALSVNAATGAANDRFSLSTTVDYENSKIIITGVTPAKYRQLINVIIYKPENFSVPSDITNPENPQSQFPLKSVGSIQRIENIHADNTGEFSVEFKTAKIPEGYYIVSASGGGYMSDVSKDSELICLMSEENIEVLLSRISAAQKEELLAIIPELKSKYGMNLGDGYETDPDRYINYFIAVREDDFLGCFETFGEVQKAFDGVNLIMSTVGDTSLVELKAAYEAQNQNFAVFDETDKDYVENKDAVYSILKNIANKTDYAFSIYALKIMFRQAQGIAAINTKDAGSVTESIVKYGEVLGIDVEEYLTSCKKYREIEVNMAFVGRDFILPSEVVSAYDACIEELEKTSSSGSGGGGGGGGVIPGIGTESVPSEINITSFAVGSEEISYTISVNDYRYSAVCVAIYDTNMKMQKIKVYKLTNTGTYYISGEILKCSGMKYFRIFCVAPNTLEPACINIEKRI